MSTINLNRATNNLAKYFGLTTLADLAHDDNNTRSTTTSQVSTGTTTTSNTNSSPSGTSKIVKEMIRLLIDSSEGGITTQNLLNTLNSFTKNDTQSQDELNQYLRVFLGQTKLNGVQQQAIIADMLGGSRNPNVNQNTNSSDRLHPNLSIIEVNHCGVTPATKNANAITIFLNGIPTIELARSVPYINVEFQFPRSPTDANNKAQTLSLYKLLEGAASSGNTDQILLNATKTNSENADEARVGFATAGMELFTTPQTLVNANTDNSRNLHATPILDKFRPFMSLKQVTLDVVPAGGLMSFKSGKIEFTLHDKSRLSEMADFISPNLYGGTEIFLEYGWIHPDGPEKKNNFADVINGMRCKEKYGIYNSSFAFDDIGQVQITLQIAMRGSQEFKTETITDNASDEDIQNTLRRINTLQHDIGELRRQRNQGRPHGAREIRGVQILDAAEDASSNLVLSDELKRALTQFQSDVRRSPNNITLTNLSQQITTLYGSGQRPNNVPNTSLISQLRASVRRSIQQKFADMGNTPEPFVVQETTQSGQQANSGPSRNGTRSNNASQSANAAVATEGRRERISLAKLLLLFVGAPIVGTQKFDDVQLLFYPFNSYAGHARDKNISQFTVDKNYFINQYAQYRLNNISRAANVSLRDFLGFIAATIIDDSAAESYGLRAFRHREPRNSTDSTLSEPISSNTVTTQNIVDNALRGITPDGSFRMPQIDFYIECIPEDPAKTHDSNGSTTDSSRLKSILRIHIFDKQNTGYDSQGALLSALQDDVIMHLTAPDTTNAANQGVAISHNQVAGDIIRRATDAGIIRAVAPPNASQSGEDSIQFPRGIYESALSPKSIKEFVMSTMPYIIHGAGGTAVKRAALSSMHDPALTTVNMLRSFRASPIEANGERIGGIPLQIIPCELGMTTFGCPLLDFGFQVFIDFGTNTTVDNIYGITGLTHTLSPGKFDTEIKFVALDSYGKYVPLIERLGAVGNVLNAMDQTNQNTQQANALAQNDTQTTLSDL